MPDDVSSEPTIPLRPLTASKVDIFVHFQGGVRGGTTIKIAVNDQDTPATILPTIFKEKGFTLLDLDIESARSLWDLHASTGVHLFYRSGSTLASLGIFEVLSKILVTSSRTCSNNRETRVRP
jgi:hypothetical protein